MKPGDLVRIKRENEWRYKDIPGHPASASAILVLATKSNRGNVLGRAGNVRGTIKISNEPENLWVPKKYFEVISAGR